ncbi:MAG: VTT domain-containing protein [Gemmatimonadetes bacterium]|nr:VTT domain-containing protein [Gemmatimonadota bacterium]
MAAVKRGRPLLKLGLLALVIVAGTLIARVSPLAPYFTREGVGEAIQMLRASAWAPLVYVTVYTVATALAFPGSVLTLAGGALFGVAWGTLYTSIAANLGANLAFLLARSLGREGIQRLAGSRLSGLDRAAEQHGFRALLALRLIPLVPFNALNFGSGLTAIPWRSYALATLVGILPGTIVYTFFADALLQGSQEASREALLRILVAGGLLVLLSLIPVIARRRSARTASVLLIALVPTLTGATSVLGPHATGVPTQTTFAWGKAPLPAAQEVPDHAALTAVLQQVVDGKRVDYRRLQSLAPELDAYIASLGRTSLPMLDGAGRSGRLAFWINAYNACMLSLVSDHYPIRKATFPRSLVNAVAGRPANSVWQIPDVFTDKFCFIAGAERSLDEIEHEILRPLREPRIHFAINCAARGCPPLAAEAYTAGDVDAQLDAAVRRFTADPQHLRIQRGPAPRVSLNMVLSWFGEDFGGESGVRQFLAPHLPPTDRSLILDAATLIEYLDYDWTLNDVEP